MLDIGLTLLLIVLAGLAIYAVIEAVSTLRSVRVLADDMEERLGPLADEARATLDALRSEIERVDGIVAQVEQASDRVTATAKVAEEVVREPLVRLAGLGGGVKGLLGVFRGVRRR